MLLKTDHDAIEKVRSDPRVREVIDDYRKFVTFPDKKPSKFFTSVVIKWIGKVYREVTGKSPRTTDISSGKNLFIDFVIKLFQREGLDPPTTYAIRQATKKNKP